MESQVIIITLSVCTYPQQHLFVFFLSSVAVCHTLIVMDKTLLWRFTAPHTLFSDDDLMVFLR